MKTIFIFFISINFVLPIEPKPLIGQRNQTKTSPNYKFIKIKKSYISYRYGINGNKVITVNFDESNRLASKSSYNLDNKQFLFLENEDCKKTECFQFIHK